LTDSLNGYVGVSPRYRSRTEAAFGASPVFEIGAYGLLDLRGGVATPDGHWRAEIWGHNVTDRVYLTNITHISDTVDRITGMPGTYGITFTYRY
jgi:iron complex outermembrane receptor protein